MKRRLTAGYTILEVMIVMTVSAGLLVVVARTFSGRQGSTELSQSVRDFESKVQTTINDVSSGDFPNGFDCSAGVSGAVNITNSSSRQPGANTGCIFLGKVMVLHQDASDIFTVVGRQFVGGVGSADVADLNQAIPQAVAKAGGPDVTSTYTHRLGLQVTKMIRQSDKAEIGGVGFINELGSSASASNPASGSRSVLLYALNGVSGIANTDLPLTSAGKINTSGSLTAVPGGVKICLIGGRDQRAEIIIGDNNNQSSTYVNLDSGVSSDCAS